MLFKWGGFWVVDFVGFRASTQSTLFVQKKNSYM